MSQPSPAPPQIGHEVIIANAGCGKTEALAMRYIKLLRAGARAEGIVALTFTRAAAGEFFERIVQLLARAALQPSGLERLREGIGDPSLAAGDCLALLRQLLQAMPRLILTTLDSFCFRVVQAYPFELGLEAPPEMIDTALADQERQRVLLSVLDNPLRNEGRRDQFLRAIDLASFGGEERSAVRFVMDLVRQGHDTWLDAPDEALWDPVRQLWGGVCPWQPPAAFDPDKAIDRLADALRQAEMPDKSRPRFDRFIDELREHPQGTPPGKDMTFVFDKLFAVWPHLGQRPLEVVIDRHKVTLDPALGGMLRDIVLWFMWPEWDRRLQSTVGIGRVLAAYEDGYESGLRARGRLTFADVLVLLSGRNGLTLSQDSAGEGRLRIDYRLDARFDHWMLDEFQDTSLVQWRTLSNLVDEVVQDAGDQRTLFYVGDLKQSIYGWRGAAPELFHSVREYYNQGQQPRLPQSTLPLSYRYRPAIARLVNRTFGPESALHPLFGKGVSTTWQHAWVDHESAPPLQNHDGYAAVLQPAGEPDEGDQERRWNVVLQLLEKVRPHKARLSCAVLVRKNDDVRDLALWLRQQSDGRLPVTAVGRDSVATDNETGRILLHLLTLAANPTDRYSWQRLLMCPPIAAGAGLHPTSATTAGEPGEPGAPGETDKPTSADNATSHAGDDKPARWTPARLATHVWRDVQMHGFEDTLLHWLDLLVPPADPFNRRRGLAVVDLGRRFDRTGSRSISEFIDFARAADAPAESVPGGIQVMTVHASKGLGFDLVILPELQGQSLDTPRSSRSLLTVARDQQHQVDWILAECNARLRSLEPRLQHQHDLDSDRTCIESLCLLYVAMTRARHALYLVIDSKPSSRSNNYPKLLRDSLDIDPPDSEAATGDEPHVLWQDGDPDWAVTLPRPGPPPAAATAAPAPLAGPRPDGAPPVLRLPRLAPSDHAPAGFAGYRRGADLASNLQRRHLGNEVHQALEQVAWTGPAHQQQIERQLGQWRRRLSAQAFEMVANTLASPATAGCFQPIDPASELWREQAFEMELDGHWVSGVFDRVEVTPERVRLIDFKTSERQPDGRWPIDRHKSQLLLYARVLARLLGRDPADIEPVILYVTGPKAVVISRT